MMSNPERIQAPRICGNEEETGLLIDYGDGRGFDEPYDFVSRIEEYLPGGVVHQDRFLSNGSKIYPGGTCDPVDGLTNLERATPECTSAQDLTTHIRSSEELLVRSLSNYVQNISTHTGNTVRGRIQRRVVDNYGTRKGCHDSLSVHLDEIAGQGDQLTLHESVLGHVATRSFVTGAGYVKPDNGTYFAQKIGGLEETRGYYYRGSMYRTDVEDGSRLEIRCNDINISDWATRMRIGSEILAVTIAKTPLRSELPIHGSHDRMYQQAKLYNSYSINPDGSIDSYDTLRHALRYQRLIAEISIGGLEDFMGELDEDLSWTAGELLQYCYDFEKVLNGEADISLLADRADWAAKFKKIHDDYVDRSAYEPNATLTDIRAQYLDLKYDHIGIQATDGVLRRPHYGYGYKLRNKGAFAYTAPQPDVERGVYQPPRDTRARARADIIRHFPVNVAKWSKVYFREKGTDKVAILSDPTSSTASKVAPYVSEDYRL